MSGESLLKEKRAISKNSLEHEKRLTRSKKSLKKAKKNTPKYHLKTAFLIVGFLLAVVTIENG